MASYVLNDQIIFNDELCTLCIKQKNIDLDFKLAQLLAFFIQHQGQVVSREQILARVWPNTIVNDNTINWSISQLRKALGDSPASAQFIKTIPKKGYQFIAVVSLQSEIIAASKGVTKTRFHYNALAIALGTLLLAIVSWYWFFSTPDKQLQLTNIQPITALDGIESSPILLTDQQALVFRHRAPSDSGYRLRLQPLVEHLSFKVDTAEGGKQDVSSQRLLPSYLLAEDEFDYRALSAGFDGFNFFAVRRIKANVVDDWQCQIVQLTLTPSRDALAQSKHLTDCHGDSWSKIAYQVESNRLFYTDRANNGLYAVFSLDLKSMQIRQHSYPTDSGLGDHFIDLNLAQDKLLVLRDEQNAKTSFLVLNIASNELIDVLEINDFYYTAYFSPSGDAIWHNWSNAIVRQQPIAQAPPQNILTTNFGWNYNAKPLSKELAVFNVSDSNDGDLLFWDGQLLERHPNSAKEAFPTKAGDDYAFISNRSGLPQIWLQAKEQAPRQLSNLTQYHAFHELSFSPDGLLIAGVTQQSLGLINLADQRYRSLSEQQYFARNLSWSANGDALYFSEQKDGEWLGYEVQLNLEENNIRELAIVDAQFIREDNGSRLLYSHSQVDGLFVFDRVTEARELLLPGFPKNTFWHRVADKVYFIQRQPVLGLYVTPISEFLPQLVTHLPENTLSRFAVDAEARQFIFENVSKTQADLKLANISYINVNN